ncbi:MAG TPA: DUF6485 family protein [bacterium]|nr:DUF6485 family protein [bacterium]HPL95372.1 DUF6485 family protein [bacterium]
MLCAQTGNLKHCPCTYPNCDKKGKCCECLKYHLASQELPACCFNQKTEKTFDRSFSRFIIDHQ